MKKTFFILLSLLFFNSCFNKKNTIFIIDISGSMQQENLLLDVKKSIKKILLDYSSGDTVNIVTFSTNTSLLVSKKIKSNNDLQDLFDDIDKLEAKGAWTNLSKALDESLHMITDIQKKHPGQKVVLILYTDGKNDPPPDLKAQTRLNFKQKFQEYYKKHIKDSSWYIYYVELNEPDPELEAFIKSTQKGTIISKEEFNSGIDFTAFKISKKNIFLISSGSIFFILMILFIFKPWFRRVSLVPLNSGSGADRGHAISLGRFKKKIFSNSLSVGTSGDIRVQGTNIANKHAAIGVDYKGDYYIKPTSNLTTKVNDIILTSKRTISPGETIQIGSQKFIFEKNKKK